MITYMKKDELYGNTHPHITDGSNYINTLPKWDSRKNNDIDRLIKEISNSL